MNMLKLEKITSGYGRKKVLNDVSFDVHQGDFLGIIGPNGSGKTTLLRVMTKILTPWQGKVLLEGRSLDEIREKDLAKRMAVVPQTMQEPFFSYSVKDFILLGRTPYLKRFQLLESEEDLRVVRKVMQETGSIGLEERNLEDLSGGERQLTLIARALAQEPRLLLLDEPTAHLDITHQVRILDLVKKLNRERGLTVIIILHDLNLASEYCDRLALLNEGRVERLGRPEEILDYKIIEQVYKTVVVIKKNPISGKPYILVISEEEKQRTKNGDRLLF